ncbi:MAG TPA: cob(I)yrinic acid a,c-diamide adenosyltransferase [Saprospiraceae bacterium]|nr:cob(I)yrinic acid a,c-diamide adenosyltransferase [Saprospiraceae bacterium]
MKIYTKTGDKGETSIFGGKRLLKDDIRIEAYGTVDELNSYLGLIRDHISEEYTRELLKQIQDRLFTIGSNLASDPEKELTTPDIFPEDIERLEQKMDEMNESLAPLKHFILPGGHPLVSYCHIARCVCRRAERRVVSLSQQEQVEAIVVRYLNRLSDYLFVLARKLSKDLEVAEVAWRPRSK